MTEIARPFWRGINHLALITNDMDATTRFWHGVLGARNAVAVRHQRAQPEHDEPGDGGAGVEVSADERSGPHVRTLSIDIRGCDRPFNAPRVVNPTPGVDFRA